MDDNIHLERLKDVYRVHDAAKKQKKEQKKTDDDREFKDFLDESGKEPEGYHEYVYEDEVPEPPPQQMLNMLGGLGPQIKIEPIDAPPPEAKKPAAAPPAGTDENKSE